MVCGLLCETAHTKIYLKLSRQMNTHSHWSSSMSRLHILIKNFVFSEFTPHCNTITCQITDWIIQFYGAEILRNPSVSDVLLMTTSKCVSDYTHVF